MATWNNSIATTVGDSGAVNVDFSNVVGPDTDADYHGHNLMVEMRGIFMENAQIMQKGIESDLDSIHLQDQVSEAAKEFANDLQNALTAATAQGTKGQVTLSATQLAQIQSFAEQHGVDVDGEGFDDWMQANNLKPNSTGALVMSQQNAGDLVAGMNDCSQSASDTSQQLMTGMQVKYSYVNADNTTQTSMVKDWTDLVSSIGRNF